MTRFKIIIALIAAILALIVVFQNTETVQTRLLFATVEMPRAVLLLLTLTLGFIAGLLFALGLSSRSKRV